jgi:Glycosyltransferase family 87
LIKPMYALPILLVCCVQHRWKVIGSFALSTLALFALPIPFMGVGVTGAYLRQLGDRLVVSNVGTDIPESKGQSVYSSLRLLWSPAVADLLLILVTIGLCLVLVVVSRRSQEIDLPFASAVLVALLASPHVLLHDLTLGLLSVAVALRYRQAAPRVLTWVLGLGCVSLFAGFLLVSRLHFQLSVLAMAALLWWLYMAGQRNRGGVVRSLKDGAHAG